MHVHCLIERLAAPGAEVAGEVDRGGRAHDICVCAQADTRAQTGTRHLGAPLRDKERGAHTHRRSAYDICAQKRSYRNRYPAKVRGLSGHEADEFTTEAHTYAHTYTNTNTHKYKHTRAPAPAVAASDCAICRPVHTQTTLVFQWLLKDDDKRAIASRDQATVNYTRANVNTSDRGER